MTVAAKPLEPSTAVIDGNAGDFVALANEEIALRQALGRDFIAREPVPGTLGVWSVKEDKAVLVA